MVDGTRELMNIVSVLTDEPKLHKDFPANEQSEQYLPQVCNEKPTNGLVYTYGSRLHGRHQIDEIIKSLSEGLFNRNGVSTTWEPPEDYNHPPPCLVLAMFRIHPINKHSVSTNVAYKELLKSNTSVEPASDYTHILYTTTVFRSHDYYKGFPMNLWALWYLGQKVINRITENINRPDIKIKHGELTNVSIAAHVYEQDFKKLEKVEPLPGIDLDYRGYFTISLLRDIKKLRVALMSNTDKEIEAWESDDICKLCKSIQTYITDSYHAMYMGRELMKAKICLDNGDEYVQS